MSSLPHAGTWSSPVVGGARPPPCAGFTLTVIADNSALLIGGGTDEELLDMHVVYIIDLKRMVSYESEEASQITDSVCPFVLEKGPPC